MSHNFWTSILPADVSTPSWKGSTSLENATAEKNFHLHDWKGDCFHKYGYSISQERHNHRPEHLRPDDMSHSRTKQQIRHKLLTHSSHWFLSISSWTPISFLCCDKRVVILAKAHHSRRKKKFIRLRFPRITQKIYSCKIAPREKLG